MSIYKTPYEKYMRMYNFLEELELKPQLRTDKYGNKSIKHIRLYAKCKEVPIYYEVFNKLNNKNEIISTHHMFLYYGYYDVIIEKPDEDKFVEIVDKVLELYERLKRNEQGCIFKA